jgi:hypothetical protein
MFSAGTSLPEVATSLIAAMRGERDIAVENVIGSNIFNILGVLGISAALAPDGIRVPLPVLKFDLPVMIAVAVLCLPIFFNGMTVFRWEGWLLLGYFALYMTYILLRASLQVVPGGFSALVVWIVLPITILTLLTAMTANLLRLRKIEKRKHHLSIPYASRCLVPVSAANLCPVDIYDRWFDSASHGALSRIGTCVACRISALISPLQSGMGAARNRIHESSSAVKY